MFSHREIAQVSCERISRFSLPAEGEGQASFSVQYISTVSNCSSSTYYAAVALVRPRALFRKY
jgi:hypothetical protein